MRTSVFVSHTTYLKSNITQMMGLQEKLTYQIGSGSPLTPTHATFALPLTMRIFIAPLSLDYEDGAI